MKYLVSWWNLLMKLSRFLEVMEVIQSEMMLWRNVKTYLFFWRTQFEPKIGQNTTKKYFHKFCQIAQFTVQTHVKLARLCTKFGLAWGHHKPFHVKIMQKSSIVTVISFVMISFFLIDRVLRLRCLVLGCTTRLDHRTNPNHQVSFCSKSFLMLSKLW